MFVVVASDWTNADERGLSRRSKLIEASSPDVDRLILDRNPLAEGSWAVADMLKANNKLKELHLRMVRAANRVVSSRPVVSWSACGLILQD